MEIYCKTAVDGRIEAADLAQVAPEWVPISLPDGALYQIFDYRVVGGQLVHDPLPAPEPAPTEKERLDALESAMLELAMMQAGVM